MRVYIFLVESCSQLSGLARGVVRSGLVLFVVLSTHHVPALAGEWQPLAADGLHDPRSRGLKILQQPAEALSRMTPDYAGNQVRWVQALEKGEIKPRERLYPQTEIRKLDRDIILDTKGSMAAVRFPHRQHTEWLDCVNCHDGIFKQQTGATNITMFNILQGEQCGVCHGAVAFPLTECMRCHSIPRPKNANPVMPASVDPKTHKPLGQVTK